MSRPCTRLPGSAPAFGRTFVAAAALCAGCQDDASLWGDSMSPTQMQQSDGRSNVQPFPFATTQGDSDDPFVDNPNYPFVEEPWWQNPAYNGG